MGLDRSTHLGHVARAVLEGTAFAMRDVIDRLASSRAVALVRPMSPAFAAL